MGRKYITPYNLFISALNFCTYLHKLSKPFVYRLFRESFSWNYNWVKQKQVGGLTSFLESEDMTTLPITSQFLFFRFSYVWTSPSLYISLYYILYLLIIFWFIHQTIDFLSYMLSMVCLWRVFNSVVCFNFHFYTFFTQLITVTMVLGDLTFTKVITETFIFCYSFSHVGQLVSFQSWSTLIYVHAYMYV